VASKTWRSLAEIDSTVQLPPLAKGANRHRCPVWEEPRALVRTQAMDSTALRDSAHAEALGSKILGDLPWPDVVFDEASGGVETYLRQAEVAALANRFGGQLGDGQGRFNTSNFGRADRKGDGRVSLEEWKDFCEQMQRALGHQKCRKAAMRYLGFRAAEPRKRLKNIIMFDGFDQEASLQLLMACSKWSSSSLYDNICKALEQRADPNAALTGSGFNGYTPLIFLSMAQPGMGGPQVGMAIDTLVKANADVHRESGPHPLFGRLVPLRFAAQLQNKYAVQSLLQYVDVGDRFRWAAGENVELVMLNEMEKMFGKETRRLIAKLSRFSTQATIMLRKSLRLPDVGKEEKNNDGTAERSAKLLAGEFEDGNIQKGSRADPDGPGLGGMTALMECVQCGDLDSVQVLLAGRANPGQQNSNGATALHLAAIHLRTDIARVLLESKAQPDVMDHGGYTAWMLVGEAAKDESFMDDGGTAARQQLIEMLRPAMSPESILDMAEKDETKLINEEGSSEEVLQRRLRLHESLFFDPRLIVNGAYEGRGPRAYLLKRVANLLIQLLKTDPLSGKKKALTKYLLLATMGPKGDTTANHVQSMWEYDDNRCTYRDQLMEAVKGKLGDFARECSTLRMSIDGTSAESYCGMLRNLPKDKVNVPSYFLSQGPFWEKVQERNLLRYDPEWALKVKDSASCALALLRLGAVRDLAEISALHQVHHMPMEALMAKGYVAYSQLCNTAFQEKMKAVAARVAKKQNLDVTPPEGIVGAKRIKRLMEKTAEAVEERGDMEATQGWPQRSADYLEFSHSFYILDTVRLSFVCGGGTMSEQVACCIKLFEEFKSCTVENDGLCMMRQKSGFAQGVEGAGGYADVKLLCYADLGVHTAFDGTEVPLKIVGEVQLILRGYSLVKHRMHLAYEVDRGSFDHRKPS